MNTPSKETLLYPVIFPIFTNNAWVRSDFSAFYALSSSLQPSYGVFAEEIYDKLNRFIETSGIYEISTFQIDEKDFIAMGCFLHLPCEKVSSWPFSLPCGRRCEIKGPIAFVRKYGEKQYGPLTKDEALTLARQVSELNFGPQVI